MFVTLHCTPFAKTGNIEPQHTDYFFLSYSNSISFGSKPPWGESKVKVWIVQTIVRVRCSVCLGDSSAVLFGVDARVWT